MDSDVFGFTGQVSILLWGAAYGICGYNSQGGEIWALFALEKLLYVYSWLSWHSKYSLKKEFKRARCTADKLDLLVPAFFAVYGLGDLVFCGMFLSVYWSTTMRDQ